MTGTSNAERVGDLLRGQAARTPDRELFVFEGRRVSYAEFDAWVTTVAFDLVRRGVRRGDRVMVQLPNCLEALVLQVAAFRIGAVDMPAIPIYRKPEFRQIVAESPPAVVPAAAQLSPRQPAAELDLILAELGHEPAVRYVTGGERPGWQAVPGPGEVAETALPEPLPAHEPALLLYTSGTTSAPKGALLTSAALIAHMRNFATALGVGEDCVTLCATPVSHLGGFVAGVIFPAFLGARSVIMPGWRPDEAVEVIGKERASLAMGATVFLADLVQRYEAGAGTDHRLDLYACAGATLPPSLVLRAAAVGVRALRRRARRRAGRTALAVGRPDPAGHGDPGGLAGPDPASGGRVGRAAHPRPAAAHRLHRPGAHRRADRRRRLVLPWRRRRRRRAGLGADVRPDQGHHQPGRGEVLRARHRVGDRLAPGRGRGRGHRRPGRTARRGGRRLDRAGAGRGVGRPRHADPAPGGRQAGPAEDPHPVDGRARAADHGQREDPE